ncbi:hypothetical protein C0992_006235 [Termitomyces sp. T32_za158]|nr:hypothetical protein C0992_006235 [Termitomyces sp. T32_za158]
MHHDFQQAEAVRFHPHELKAARNLLRRLLVSSDDVMEELLQMAGETIMSITYGIQVESKDDPYITNAKEGVHGFHLATVPGTFLVNSIPILKYVPEWMPFAGFKRQAKHWRRSVHYMHMKPYEAAKYDFERGNATMSFVSSCLRNMDSSSDPGPQEDIIRSTAGTMPFLRNAAGSDTTVAAIATGILGLLTNPQALKKAQDEIDRVVGPDNLPTFGDENSLPYITAITKETLRWREVTPIGTYPRSCVKSTNDCLR